MEVLRNFFWPLEPFILKEGSEQDYYFRMRAEMGLLDYFSY